MSKDDKYKILIKKTESIIARLEKVKVLLESAMPADKKILVIKDA